MSSDPLEWLLALPEVNTCLPDPRQVADVRMIGFGAGTTDARLRVAPGARLIRGDFVVVDERGHLVPADPARKTRVTDDFGVVLDVRVEDPGP